MIDAEAVKLVNATKAQLAGMKDARPSEVLAIKEAFGEAFLALLARAKDGITAEHKIKIFDELLEGEVEHLHDSIMAALVDGSYFPDEDHDHYTYEAVVSGTLGNDIWTATNELETLLTYDA
jgi:hypothetical protein